MPPLSSFHLSWTSLSPPQCQPEELWAWIPNGPNLLRFCLLQGGCHGQSVMERRIIRIKMIIIFFLPEEERAMFRSMDQKIWIVIRLETLFIAIIIVVFISIMITILLSRRLHHLHRATWATHVEGLLTTSLRLSQTRPHCSCSLWIWTNVEKKIWKEPPLQNTKKYT